MKQSVLAEVESWAAEFERLCERIGPRFARPEVRRRAAGFLRGLLGGVDRKNGWQLAEHARETTPDGMQRLLTTTRWDPDALRDDLRAYVVEHLGDPGGVLVVDETGFLKKGGKSAGVQRQYSGTAGRIENCQVGVFLAYASGKGRALVDRELYPPKEWAIDVDRRAEAHVPAQVGFQTKPQLAQAMLERAVDAQVPAGWVTADEVYGGDARLRAFLEQQDLAYVLAVKATQPLWAAGEQGPAELPARQLVARLPARAWRRLSAGDGAKGPRVYDWARIALTRPGWPGRGFWLLVRRRLSDGELAFYACFGPADTTLAELVQVAGVRWAVDVVFPVAKTFTSHDVRFVHGEATTIDPTAQQVQTSQGMLGFDYLVIATGYLNDFEVVPGLGPGGNAYAITSLEGAVDAAEGWTRLVNDPGPVVVAATQGAACFGAAYEFVFNATYQLRKQKLQVPVAYVSAEPFPGHFGIGGLPGGERMLGMFFRRQKIEPIFDVAMEEVAPGELRLADGRKLPFNYGMVVPPFLGAEVVTASGLGNAKGFIEVKDTYQTLEHPNVYAVGIAAAVNAPWTTANAVGVPKTGFPAETMAHVAAENIAAQMRGQEPTKQENFGDIPAVCIMDAGNNGVVILADRMLPPRKHGVMIPGPQSHAAKLAFEKYFLWKMRHGYVRLP